ncbi:MAG: hypothetical protein BMS9Abin37_2294 [Acidobacteriota bacterium]|nr:MAG: hypothetical protein BMS9Abin37_2294 [Acidobacteriota bacterium]
MVLFNYALKELTAKIVYYGPGLSGKTTNLQYIHEELPIKNKGRMLTLATETDRTLYFDFLPVDAGIVRGIKTRVQLYTVPGQVFYNATRRMVLKGADGVVFVADSQQSMMEANLESLENLRENLMAHDLKLEDMPMVMQFNKRDLEDVGTIEAMNDRINTLNVPFYEAVAKDGVGVEETLQAISGLVLKSVIDRYGGDRGMSPMGSRLGSANDPSQTDPDALVSATAARGGAKAQVGQSGGSGRGRARTKDIHAQTVNNWPVSEEDIVASSEEKPIESFEDLNIEGILDDALRLDAPESPPPEAPTPSATVDTDSMFSGLLEEALGAEKTDSILDGAFGVDETPSQGPSTEPPVGGNLDVSDPIRDIEAELMGGKLEPVEDGSSLSELIKTRVSIPADKFTTTPPASAKPSDPKRVEVPVTIQIDGTEREIELLLKISFKKK